MKLLSFLLLIALSFSGSAFASGKAFPPDDCSETASFMSFTGVEGANTKCRSGQDILKSTIPTCLAGEIVAYNGTDFYCKKETSNLPTCNPNEFLSFDGETYQCKSSGVATCSNNQVLTFNGTSYYCVNKDATIPVCGANQFLTYNGSYQCASVNTPAIPNCAAGQVVTGNGSQLYCTAGAPAVPNCPSGYVMTGNGSQFYCTVDTGGAACPTYVYWNNYGWKFITPTSLGGSWDPNSYAPGPTSPSGMTVFVSMTDASSGYITSVGSLYGAYGGYNGESGNNPGVASNPMYTCVNGSWLQSN